MDFTLQNLPTLTRDATSDAIRRALTRHLAEDERAVVEAMPPQLVRLCPDEDRCDVHLEVDNPGMRQAPDVIYELDSHQGKPLRKAYEQAAEAVSPLFCGSTSALPFLLSSTVSALGEGVDGEGSALRRGLATLAPSLCLIRVCWVAESPEELVVRLRALRLADD